MTYMLRSGSADLPLHGGRAPRWLFERMVPLAGAVAEAVVDDAGRAGLLRRLSDPFWFQALSCALGFDWHSSGTTTTTMGALKDALSSGELGLAVAGGKGRASRRTPAELATAGERLGLGDGRVASLVRASRLCAKVDTCMVQDGYALYHHAMVVSEDGGWAVVQQGMNGGTGMARRYHWLFERAGGFVEEPHSAICCDERGGRVLDLTARESRESRSASLELALEGPGAVLRHLRRQRQATLGEFGGAPTAGARVAPARGELVGGYGAADPMERAPELRLPRRHEVLPSDLGRGGLEALERAMELQPSSYAELLEVPGMGPRRIRALALVAELAYGASPSWRDPARFSFAHGGKDGHPYPVDRGTYDATIASLREALDGARVGSRERLEALGRLGRALG